MNNKSTQMNISITNDTGAVTFVCPAFGINAACKGEIIIRTAHERTLAVPYTCPSCGFTGPN